MRAATAALTRNNKSENLKEKIPFLFLPLLITVLRVCHYPLMSGAVIIPQ